MFRLFPVLIIMIIRVESLEPTDENKINEFVDDIYETLSNADNEEDGTKKIQSAVDTVDEMETNNKNISEIMNVPAVIQNKEIFQYTLQIYKCILTIDNNYKHLQKMLTAESDEDRQEWRKLFIGSPGSLELIHLNNCIKQVSTKFLARTSMDLSYIVAVATILTEKNVDDADEKFFGMYSTAVVIQLKAFITKGYNDFLSFRQDKEQFEQSLTNIRDETKVGLEDYARELEKAEKVLN